MKDWKKLVFGDDSTKTVTLAQLEQALSANGVKLADLSEGDYVSTEKYNASQEQVKSLTGTLDTRTAELTKIQKQLEGVEDIDSLKTVSKRFAALQDQYNKETADYKAQLDAQKYQFAVKTFAGTKKFTSRAAQRDFEQSLISKKLSMEGDSIIGAEDFAKNYLANNPDAFVTETPKVDTKPQFVAPTQQETHTEDDTKGFASAFNFTYLRPVPKQ